MKRVLHCHLIIYSCIWDFWDDGCGSQTFKEEIFTWFLLFKKYFLLFWELAFLLISVCHAYCFFSFFWLNRGVLCSWIVIVCSDLTNWFFGIVSLGTHGRLNWREFSLEIWCLSDSKFTQQELPACKPILTPRAVRLPVWTHCLLVIVYVNLHAATSHYLCGRNLIKIFLCRLFQRSCLLVLYSFQLELLRYLLHERFAWVI